MRNVCGSTCHPATSWLTGNSVALCGTCHTKAGLGDRQGTKAGGSGQTQCRPERRAGVPPTDYQLLLAEVYPPGPLGDKEQDKGEIVGAKGRFPADTFIFNTKGRPTHPDPLGVEQADSWSFLMRVTQPVQRGSPAWGQALTDKTRRSGGFGARSLLTWLI